MSELDEIGLFSLYVAYRVSCYHRRESAPSDTPGEATYHFLVNEDMNLPTIVGIGTRQAAAWQDVTSDYANWVAYHLGTSFHDFIHEMMRLYREVEVARSQEFFHSRLPIIITDDVPSLTEE